MPVNVKHGPELQSALIRMRRDWNERASADALHYVYTRDSSADELDFDASGQANYNQLVRPFLPVLLDGRAPGNCRVVEIGCGPGRMTRWFAAEFGEVHAVDISEEMIARGRERLRDVANVRWHVVSGGDLACLPDERFDLAFSYIVFQHIPLRSVIENYVREAARVLKPGGVFKFQLNGDQSPAYRQHSRDTWFGETYSLSEAREMLDAAGLSLLAAEGTGTQYFVLTVCKRRYVAGPGLRPYIFPGEAWAAAQLLAGWGEPVNGSWRPLAPRSETLLAVPAGQDLRFFAGLYFWPGAPFPSRTISVRIDGTEAGAITIAKPGDHYFEFPAPWRAPSRPEVRIALEIDPPDEASAAPAVRCLGLYRVHGRKLASGRRRRHTTRHR